MIILAFDVSHFFPLVLYLATTIMHCGILALFSLVVAGLAAGSSAFQGGVDHVERQVNASSLNATLLEILTDVEGAKTCSDCEACLRAQIYLQSMLISSRIS